MKKILTVVALSLLLFSCSNESEVAKEVSINKSTFAKEGDADLDKLYDNMIKSEAYVVYESLQKDFLNKVNFTGDVSDVDTNEKLLDWINDNLSQTSFKNIEEAKGQSGDLKLAFYKVYQANEKLFIGSATSVDPKKDLTRFVPIRFPDDSITANGDPCGCGAAFTAAMTQSQNDFKLQIGGAIGKLLIGAITGPKASDMIEHALGVFQLSAGIHGREYLDCYAKCVK